jgi:hypothetical protein
MIKVILITIVLSTGMTTTTVSERFQIELLELKIIYF